MRKEVHAVSQEKPPVERFVELRRRHGDADTTCNVVGNHPVVEAVSLPLPDQACITAPTVFDGEVAQVLSKKGAHPLFRALAKKYLLCDHRGGLVYGDDEIALDGIRR